ncbi:MAG TPA: hypothetical protein VGP13_03625, partial [Candidatus Paceibacterota bacterium]|nr:hypothetical protein [Candidatus Paceibacterota bacterium]
EPATSVAPASEPVVQPDPVYVEPATPEASDVDTQQSAAEPTLSDEPVPLEVIPPPNLIPQAQAAESSDTPALAAAAATSGVAFPLWASMAGLVALVILGVSATWYARSATPKPETKVSAEEFTIE